MTSPFTSAPTSIFNFSGTSNLDSLLSPDRQKWGGSLGTGAELSFSFPWTGNTAAYWQMDYSSDREPYATQHFGLNATQMSAVRSAFREWANVANLKFTEVSETGTNVGDFRFAFSSVITSDTWGWCSYPDDYWASAADVWINPAISTSTDWSIGSFNFMALMHEIGHGLGLKHPGNYGGSATPFLPAELDYTNYTIMSYNDPANDYTSTNVQVVPRTPMVYDIWAIQYLYGANNSYHTEDNTYSFSSNSPFYKTLWDAGGTDTIDVSSFGTGCNIDLTPGAYSDIAFSTFNGTDNLGIAFGAMIENATGGGGNDTIIGNSAANYLIGYAGDDNILGGDQNDILAGNQGNDTLRGGTGWDSLYGGRGMDTIYGGRGADLIIGGLGNDFLTGGFGLDIFCLTAIDSADTIVDFTVADDTIQLASSVFTQLTTLGNLDANNFAVGATAADANDYVVYNDNTGALFYDEDGNGAVQAVQVALIGIGLSLTSEDFVVI